MPRLPAPVSCATLVALSLCLGAPAPVLAAEQVGDAPVAGHDAAPASDPRHGWTWPAAPFRIVRAYIQPPHRYGAGHRGVDLRPLEGDDVRSPADGVIAFVGNVAGRAIVTIDHEGGFVTTLEPVLSELDPGSPVAAGEVVGTLSVGGHTEPGTLHFGVRLNGEYINPLILLGGVPRAVLLPCCD